MFDLKDYKNIYMIGIGGISMSGLAHILASWDFSVSGSDARESTIVDELNNAGIHVNIGQKYENINKNIDLVVYTAAVKDDNPELIHAKELNIKTLERGEFLGEITKLFKDTIGIAGTHGKTTTTSMVSECFMAAGMDPSIQVGSILKSINANYKVGKSDYFIIEACEYCDSYLNFKQKSAIILNIDNDHLDYFKNFENIKKSFKEYVSHLPKDGLLVVNADDVNCLDLKNYSSAKFVTYGIENEANYKALNIEFDEAGIPSYDLYNNGEFVTRITLGVIGRHNVLNSLACVALCLNYGLEIESIKNGLLNYTGAARRFEYKGMFNGAKVYDDYGHHPTEVEAVAKSILNKKYNKSWVIFEAHSYSRVKNHYKDFAKSLLAFDNIIIADIFPAREVNVDNVSPEDIIKVIKEHNKDAIHISDYEEIKKYLSERVRKDDLVLTLGAGNITKLGSRLVNND